MGGSIDLHTLVSILSAAAVLGGIFVWKGKLDKTIEFFGVKFDEQAKKFGELDAKLDTVTDKHAEESRHTVERIHQIELELAEIRPNAARRRRAITVPE